MSKVLRTIDFVCDGPPGPESGRFVEVEDQDGHGISLGEWIKRDDGYWVLRIPDPRDLSVAQVKLAALLEPGEYGGLLEMIEHEAFIRPGSYLERLLRATATAIEQLQAKVRELDGWVHDLQSGMYVNCIYCGHRYGPRDKVPVTMADALKNHIEQCPKHPMSALKVRAEQAEARLAECMESASRKSIDTAQRKEST